MSSNPYLYAMHDPGGEEVFLKTKGWIVFTEELGHDPTHTGGRDYRRWSEDGFGVIVRLNNGYGNAGTIPEPALYPQFAQRCANFVAASRGCSRYIIGNEPNHSQECPNGQPITADCYADCYAACREAIHAIPSHEADEVLLAAIAPYNDQTGDWLDYFQQAIHWAQWYAKIDGFALHAYVHGADPALIRSEAKMGPPFEDRNYHFRTYRDSLKMIPEGLRHLPAYITEANQGDDPWANENRGWVREAYREIDEWNHGEGNQVIRALCLYRWPHYDQWGIQGKDHVVADFREAQEFGYRWTDLVPPPEPEPPTPEPPVKDNMLKNSSMEGNFTIREAQQVIVAEEWEPFYLDNVDPPTGGGSGPVYRPEYKPLFDYVDAARIKDGVKSQCWFKFRGNMDAGVYQRVSVPAGATVTFSGWVQAWCSNSDDPRVSDAEMYFKFGIDPDGGTNAYSNAVRWDDDWVLVRGEYVKRSVSVIANATHVTVFVRAWNKWAMKHNDAYLDACDFEIAGGGTEPPTPPPGDAFDWERLARGYEALAAVLRGG